jgi:large subunit ribosomal protein L25
MASDAIEITLEPRSVTGKAVRHLRKAGKVPAVIHDHGHPSIVVEGDVRALLKVYHQAGKHHPVVVTANGKTYTALIKTAEFEPRKHQLNHVVFNAVAADQMVEAEIPIEPRYSEGFEVSPAERAGLIVLNNLESVEVESLPANLPDVIYYDAEVLKEIGDQVSIGDLIVPDKVTIKADPTQAVATVYEPSALAAANDAAGGTAEEISEVETEVATGSETDEQEQSAESDKS